MWPAAKEVVHRQVQLAVVAAHRLIVALSFKLEGVPTVLGDQGSVDGLEGRDHSQIAVVALALRLGAQVHHTRSHRPSKEPVLKIPIHHFHSSINRPIFRPLSVANTRNLHNPNRNRPLPESRMELIFRTQPVPEAGFEVPEEAHRDIISQ